ncbi:hypothetical protein ACLPJK_25665 [Pseudomonas aeruginosa]|uniref:hypothetical protein n=1 Tax=Pseudomonas aeruginosa TaxID=287 RepID=UPI003D291BF9
MRLRTFYGFGHWPVNSTNIGSYIDREMNATGRMLSLWISGNEYTRFYRPAGTDLVTATNISAGIYSDIFLYLARSDNNPPPTDPIKTVIGARVRFVAPNSGTVPTNSIVSWGEDSRGTNYYEGSIQLLFLNDLPGRTAGSEYYVELVLDKVAKTITVYVDKQLIRTVSVTHADFSSGKGSIRYNMVTTGATTYNHGPRAWGDIYVSDQVDAQDPFFVLGPQRVKTLPIGWVNAPEWGNGGENVMSTFNGALGPTNWARMYDTPLASPASEAPVLYKVDTTGISNDDRVRGVAVHCRDYGASGAVNYRRVTINDVVQQHLLMPNTVWQTTPVRILESLNDQSWNYTRLSDARIELRYVSQNQNDYENAL